MNAGWALAPIVLIRYILMELLGRTALKRAAFFPPRVEKENAAYLIYQMSNLLIFLYLFFPKFCMAARCFFSAWRSMHLERLSF